MYSNFERNGSHEGAIKLHIFRLPSSISFVQKDSSFLSFYLSYPQIPERYFKCVSNVKKLGMASFKIPPLHMAIEQEGSVVFDPNTTVTTLPENREWRD
ncbi:hypothetical protein CEXT_396531 [Caerostris extrusa]|uniref:Uncharacterized protein n=1 Tax=Caerostris extrusa TaxID=172846 RepID=A0AAV4SCD8_CAEEX|nr:hypothetical protein CEXT_396531 [Caerostris extrusa]